MKFRFLKTVKVTGSVSFLETDGNETGAYSIDVYVCYILLLTNNICIAYRSYVTKNVHVFWVTLSKNNFFAKVTC